MNELIRFENCLAHARALLAYREEHYYPDENIYGEIKRQMDLAERIANKEVKHSKTLDEIDMGYIARREIEDMDPEFTEAGSDLAQSLRELLGVRQT